MFLNHFQYFKYRFDYHRKIIKDTQIYLEKINEVFVNTNALKSILKLLFCPFNRYY